VSTVLGQLKVVVLLLASLFMVLPAPAHAAGSQLTGTAFVNPFPGAPCAEPPAAYDSYPPL